MCSMYMNFNQKQHLKQLQRLIMTHEMQQAIQIMQLPLLDLSQAMQEELGTNPVLEYDEEPPCDEEDEPPRAEGEEELKFQEDDFEILKRLDEDFRNHFAESENYCRRRSEEEERLKAYVEQSVASHETLVSHLTRQARQTFDKKEELEIAEVIIGSMDERGFLHTSLHELASLFHFSLEALQKVLSKIKTFDPHGVGAKDLRECLLLQLGAHKKTNGLAYQLVFEHFDDLLNNRIPEIIKHLGCSAKEVQEEVRNTISRLDFSPGLRFSRHPIQPIVPDVSLVQEGKGYRAVINDDYLPVIRLNTRYLRMLEDESLPRKTKEFIKNMLMAAKWLLKNIDQRNKTIGRLAESIAKHQRDFFDDPEGLLRPLTMKVLAEELEVHESTIARAVSGKYIDTPRGIFPLRYFFSNAYTTADGKDISSKTVRGCLEEIIGRENKKRPLSDEAISKLLEEKGISCARRTVAKYRNELNIGNAKQRKMY